MVESLDVLARISERPFRPFRFAVAQGQMYEIRNPDLVRVRVRDITIGLARFENPDVYDRLAFVHLPFIKGFVDVGPNEAPVLLNSVVE